MQVVSGLRINHTPCGNSRRCCWEGGHEGWGEAALSKWEQSSEHAQKLTKRLVTRMKQLAHSPLIGYLPRAYACTALGASLCAALCASLCASPCVCVSLCVSAFPSLSRSAYPSVSLSGSLSVSPLSVPFSVSVCASVCAPLSASPCPPLASNLKS